jgi:hypothetical protein
MEITSVVQFVPFFPDGTVQQATQEFKSPCPFCTDGAPHTKNGIEFRGEDRLVWWIGENRFFCRRCAAVGRGRNGVYTAEDLAQRLGLTVAAELIHAEPQERIEQPLRMLWSERQVSIAHARVNRDFWYRYGWDDATINHFRLGRGVFYSADGEVNIIPMRVQKAFESPISEYAVAVRGGEGRVKKHNPGSFKPYTWLIERYPSDKTIVIAEGEKDGITDSLLGWNVAVAFGTGTWTTEKTLFLRSIGYEHIYVFGDNNEAGHLFNLRVAEICRRYGIPVQILDWSLYPEAQEDDDTTELLARLGREQTRLLLEGMLVDPPNIGVRLRGTEIEDYRNIDPNYKPGNVAVTPLDEVRGTGPKSIYANVRQFLKEYELRPRKRRGKLKLLTVGPGAGKTYTLVKIAQEEAVKYKELKLTELASIRYLVAELEAALANEEDPEAKEMLRDQIRAARRKEDEFSFTIVSWFGQYRDGWHDLLASGADEGLWFNYQARGPENCQDFATVNQMASHHHDIGAYCKVGCPFRQQCQQTGYLAQERESRKYPIVFYRHQHLRLRQAVTGKKLIVIDENPSSLIDSDPLTFKAKDVLTGNPGWETEPEDKQAVNNITLFVNAVANVMKVRDGIEPNITLEGDDRAVNPDYILFGNQLMLKIDQQVRGLSDGEHTLESLLDALDVRLIERLYQPTFLGGDRETRILQRCVPQLVRALNLEIAEYAANPQEERSSLIFLVGSTMEVYPTERIKIPAKIPVVMADATAFIPPIYEAMFDREADDIYAPTIRNPNAVVTVVTGSDWTISQIKKQVGEALTERKKLLKQTVTTITGEEVDLSDAPTGDELYSVALIRDALSLIKGLAESHKSLLVVTHKLWREPLESTIKGAYPDMHTVFGHFGALRGTNEYKDIEAIALLGMFRIPYEVVFRRAQVWMRYIDPTRHEKINPQTVIKFKPYDGQVKGHGYRTFDHWLADALVCQIEEGEMIQCIERIRPHATSERKYVYVLANRPFARFVGHFSSKKTLVDHFSNKRLLKARKMLEDAWAAGKPTLTVRELSKSAHISTRVAAKIRTDFMSQVRDKTLV